MLLTTSNRDTGNAILGMRVKNVLVVLFFLILAFQNYIVGVSGLSLFSYADEFVVLMMVFYLFLNYKSLIISVSKNKIFVIFYLLAMSIGILSSFLSRLQGVTPIVLDIFACIKFLIAFVFFQSFDDNGLLERRSFNRLILALSVLSFVIFVFDLIFKIFPRFDERFGIGSMQLFFNHPLELTLFMIPLITILTVNSKKNSINKVAVLADLIVVAMTLRAASIAYVAVLVFCVILAVFYKTLSEKQKYKWMVVFGIIALFLGAAQLLNYYGESAETVRNIMLRDGFSYALSHFPFGLGFGTFGSNVANVYNSPIYLQNGYDTLWMFRNFCTDSFLALSLGQFGLIGTLCFYLCFVCIYVKANRMQDKHYFVALIPVVFYVIISTLSTTSIFHPSYLVLICILSRYFKSGSNVMNNYYSAFERNSSD